jgi:hypothetical protein
MEPMTAAERQLHLKKIFWGVLLGILPTGTGPLTFLVDLLCLSLMLWGVLSLYRTNRNFLRAGFFLAGAMAITSYLLLAPFDPLLSSLPYFDQLVYPLEVCNTLLILAADFSICSGLVRLSIDLRQYAFRDRVIRLRSALLFGNLLIILVALIALQIQNIYSTLLVIVMAFLSVLLTLAYAILLWQASRLTYSDAPLAPSGRRTTAPSRVQRVSRRARR